MEKIKTIGPYRISIRFQTGEEWTFVLEDLSHARIMDEFFTHFYSAAAPKATQITLSDGTGIQWRGL